MSYSKQDDQDTGNTIFSKNNLAIEKIVQGNET